MPATPPPAPPTLLPSPDEIRQLLRGVIDPELGSDIVELGMAKDIVVGDDGLVEITVALTSSGCPLRSQIQRDVRARVRSLPGVTNVKLHWSELDQDEKAAAMERARWNIAQRQEETSIAPTTRVLAISSGKGGVGKSSITVNLAAALADEGYTVGVVDADIAGYSVPRMLGVEGRLKGKREGDRNVIVPHERKIGAGVVRVVSAGLVGLDEDAALMWRGLILNRGVLHFLQDVEWGDDVDYLLIDMPPGTGDIQMGVAKALPRTEVIVVTTPALAAQKVATRAVSMARKNYLRVAGVIENMTAFHCIHGDAHALFGVGGGQRLADEAGVPLLGQVPIEATVSMGGDTGEPAVLGSGPAAEAIRAIAARIVEEAVPPVAMAGCSARMLDAALKALDDEEAQSEADV